MKPANLLIVAGPGGRGVSETRPTVRPGLLDRYERMVIGDLGLAKDQERTSSEPTILGGTPHYRAPEQTQLGGGRSARPPTRSPRPPWSGGWSPGILPPAPNQVQARLVGVPDTWHEFFLRGLAAEPDERYPTAESGARRPRPRWPTPRGRAAAPDRRASPSPSRVRPARTRASPRSNRRTPPSSSGARSSSTSWSPAAGRTGARHRRTVRLREVVAAARRPAAGDRGGRPSRQPELAGRPAHARVRSAEGAAPQPSPNWTLPVPVPSLDELRADPGSVRPIATSSDGAAASRSTSSRSCSPWPPRTTRATFLAVLAALVAAGRQPGPDRHVDPRRLLRGVRRPRVAGPVHQRQPGAGRSDASSRAQHAPSSSRPPASGCGSRTASPRRVLDDAGAASGSLPLIAHALMETWLRRRGTLLTLEGFRAAGGVVGAMTQRADALYRQLDPDEQAVARRLLLRLVNPGDGTPGHPAPGDLARAGRRSRPASGHRRARRRPGCSPSTTTVSRSRTRR